MTAIYLFSIIEMVELTPGAALVVFAKQDLESLRQILPGRFLGES